MHKLDNLFNVKKIVTVHYQALPPGYVAKDESHDFWELIYADKGDVAVISDGVTTGLNRGEIFFIQPNSVHRVESGEGEPNIFIISFECRSVNMRPFANKKTKLPREKMWLLQNVMTEAENQFYIPDFDPDLNRLISKAKPPLGAEQLIKNSLESLFIYLLRAQSSSDASPYFFVSKTEMNDALEDEIVKILRDSLYKKLCLDDLCARLHYGKVKLCTFFKQKTGTSIYGAYLKFKTDEAKMLIRKGKTFSEIADLLCYDSVSSFCVSFKKISGLSPKQYRDSIKFV